ncbi:MAG: N-carbamoyl-L-amino acid amidohydrolase [Solimonas sp.]
MLFAKQSPYIKSTHRLADLIAAIQVMGTYKFASRPQESWEKKLGRDPVSAPTWNTIFREHPEFFTIEKDSGAISLVWRRSRERTFDTLNYATVSRSKAEALKEQEDEFGEKRMSRTPLNTEEISKLVDIAINLHEREIRHRQEHRWWITASIGVLGLIVTMMSK